MQSEAKRQITIHGLITHYGTARAKLCALYLHKYIPSLYAKPKIHVYYDQDWIDFVNDIRDKLGNVHRRLWYLKFPVIIFFNDKYVGDHRTIIHYVTREHGIVPDLPSRDLFPDFTQFLPKNRNKDYVFFDVRVGNLNDYVIGKMVFELDSDIAPQTCKFFKYLCEPFGEYQFSEPERKWKLSYLGSTIRRICGNSFIQGGIIPDATLLKIPDENFTVKHNRRGILSLANQGGNRSTTEFVISLKPNPFMDRNNVAFGRLIFGEPVLEAIENVPTYYQSPLKEIVIVGCGVIPSYDLWDTVDFETAIIKEKQKIVSDVQEMKKKMEQIFDFKKKVQELLNNSEKEKSIDFIFTDTKISDPDVFTKNTWTELWLRESCPTSQTQFEEEDEEGEEEHDQIGDFYGENAEEEEDEEIGDELRSEIEEEFKIFEESFGTKVLTDFTVEKMYMKRRRKDVAQKKTMMYELINSVLEKTFQALREQEAPTLEDFPVREIPDEPDVRDVPSSELIKDRYEAGLYSLPKCLRKALVDVFNNLTPSQLKLIGIETGELLKEGGISEESRSIYGSEDVLSGIMMAVIKAEVVKQNLSGDKQIENASSKEQIKDLVDEIVHDAIEAIKMKGSNLIEHLIASKESDPSIVGF